jgi:hypothetical protein
LPHMRFFLTDFDLRDQNQNDLHIQGLFKTNKDTGKKTKNLRSYVDELIIYAFLLKKF